MTMNIQVVVPKETPDNYRAKISIIDNGDEEKAEKIILKPGEVSNQICIYNSRAVKVEELEVD